MRRLLKENSLSLVLVLAFVALLGGQALTGYREHNQDQTEHGKPAIGFTRYLGSSHFLEVTMENWESEFLQMFIFVVLTSFLFQKGSAESKKLEEAEEVDRGPRKSRNKNAPWPVRRGGWVLIVYQHSLSLAFLLLFLVAFVLHAVGGAGEYNEEQMEHGHRAAVSAIGYVSTSRFWFESFQNWQSEFLAVAAMVILTIFLRQRGSPESKAVDSPHSQTGSD
jgi:Na+/H+ antiporter NhaD/arsenite permease-like protein